jgi:uncharacterized protein with PhoU and TrkA domain
VQEAVGESDEVIVRVVVDDRSGLAGTTLGGERVETETGMRVIAVRRPDADSDEWVVQPGSGTEIEGGDVLLAKGTRASSDRLRALAAG